MSGVTPRQFLASTAAGVGSPAGGLIDPTEITGTSGGPVPPNFMFRGDPAGGGGWVVAAPVQLTKDDKGLTPSATTGDEAPTGITISNLPLGDVQVVVDRLIYLLGDGVKTADCYFSGDGGTTARSIGAIVAGDQLIWNGVVVGSDLTGSEVVSLHYLV